MQNVLDVLYIHTHTHKHIHPNATNMFVRWGEGDQINFKSVIGLLLLEMKAFLLVIFSLSQSDV